MASEYLKWKYRDVKPEPEPEYSKEERRRNWWAYNGKWVLIAIAALVLLGILLKDTVFRTRPDYQIGVVMNQVMPNGVADALETALEELGEDVNGDGKVVVQVLPYEISFTDTGVQDADAVTSAMTRMAVDIGSGEVFIIIADDPEGFQERIGALAYLDGTPARDVNGEDRDYDAENWRDMVYSWSDCPVLAGLELGTYRAMDGYDMNDYDTQELFSHMYIGRRALVDDEDRERFAPGLALWEKLTRGAGTAEE